MLSRTADNMYWLARYVERAEYLARILEATQRLAAVPTSEGTATNEWESAVATAGCAAVFTESDTGRNGRIPTINPSAHAPYPAKLIPARGPAHFFPDSR